MCLCRLSEHVKTNSLFSPGKHLHTNERMNIHTRLTVWTVGIQCFQEWSYWKYLMTFSALVDTGSPHCLDNPCTKPRTDTGMNIHRLRFSINCKYWCFLECLGTSNCLITHRWRQVQTLDELSTLLYVEGNGFNILTSGLYSSR